MARHTDPREPQLSIVSSAKPREAALGLPDVRDGLTRLERLILVELARAERELNGRNVPSAMLYGRVVEHLAVSPQEFQRALERLTRKRR